MKHRNLITRFLAFLLTASLAVHLSCASSGGENGEEQTGDEAAMSEGMGDASGAGGGDAAGGEEKAAAKGGDDKAKSDFSDLAEFSEKGDQKAATDQKPAADAGKAGGKEGDDLNLDEFAVNDKGAGKDAKADTGTAKEGGGDNMDDILSTKDTSKNPEGGDKTNTAGLTDTAKEGAVAETTPTPPTETPKPPEPISDKPRHYSGPALAPKIPDRALKKKGATLNRFYFVRQNDTAAKVSQLVYGNPDKAKNLKAWNKGKWQAGKLIYYQSPAQPEEQEMRSFYQERGVQPEEYVVQKHESLFSIAQKKLGSKKSWKEIAVVNGLERSNAVTTGQKLAIYPADLSAAGTPQPPTPTAETKPEPPKPESKPPEKGPEPPVLAKGEPPVGTPPETNPGVPPVPPGPEAVTPPVGENPAITGPNGEQPGAELPLPGGKNKRKGGGMDLGKLVEQNLFTILIVAVFLALVIALSAVNKKRKSRSEDFAGEDFGSPKRRKG